MIATCTCSVVAAVREYTVICISIPIPYLNLCTKFPPPHTHTPRTLLPPNRNAISIAGLGARWAQNHLAQPPAERCARNLARCAQRSAITATAALH